VSNANELLLPAESRRSNWTTTGSTSVSLLNLPRYERGTPYATEHAVKYILTTFIREHTEAGLPIPRYIIVWEADEEVGGERPTVTSRPFCTNDGVFKKFPCWVLNVHAYKPKPKGAPARVKSEELHAKVVKCLKRHFAKERLVNLGSPGPQRRPSSSL